MMQESLAATKSLPRRTVRTSASLGRLNRARELLFERGFKDVDRSKQAKPAGIAESDRLG